MKKTAKRIVSIALLVCLLGAVATAAFALPAIPSQGLVIDGANVLTSQTEQNINTLSAALGDACGAQIAVATVDFTGNYNIDDYTYDLFDAWGLGSRSKDNGVLLLLAIDQDDYFCMIGEGLENKISSERLDDLLYYNLESGFASGDYDQGVDQFVNAMYDELCSIYNVSPVLGGEANYPQDTTVRKSPWEGLLQVLAYFLILAALASVITAIFHPVRYIRTRYFGYEYTPRPSRRHYYGRPGPYHGHSHYGHTTHGSHYGHGSPARPRPYAGGGSTRGAGAGRSVRSNATGGFLGGLGGASRPSGGSSRSSSSGSSRSSSSGSSRPSGGFSRPSGGSSRPSAGGGSSRGAGAGRRR